MVKDKKHNKSLEKNDVSDFHFILRNVKVAKEFKDEADKIGRTYTKHFIRILEERFNHL